MIGDNKEQVSDRSSMLVSVFIALCMIAVFCLISIMIVENIDSKQKNYIHKHVNLQNNKEFSEIVI